MFCSQRGLGAGLTRPPPSPPPPGRRSPQGLSGPAAAVTPDTAGRAEGSRASASATSRVCDSRALAPVRAAQTGEVRQRHCLRPRRGGQGRGDRGGLGCEPGRCPARGPHVGRPLRSPGQTVLQPPPSFLPIKPVGLQPGLVCLQWFQQRLELGPKRSQGGKPRAGNPGKPQRLASCSRVCLRRSRLLAPALVRPLRARLADADRSLVKEKFNPWGWGSPPRVFSGLGF